MIHYSPLNGMQLMILRWETFHPLNSVHLIELNQRIDIDELRNAISQVGRLLRIGPVEFCRRGRGLRFYSGTDEAPVTEPPLKQVSCDGQKDLQRLVNAELNSPFEHGIHWPFRFVIVQRMDNSSMLMLTYQHLVSDSRGISIILRHVLRALYRLRVDGTSMTQQMPSFPLLFPGEAKSRGFVTRLCSAVKEALACRSSFRADHRFPKSSQIICGFHTTAIPSKDVCSTARRSGVTVQDLLFSAMIEGFGLLLKKELRNSRRAQLTIHAPVDLRRSMAAEFREQLGQYLGCLTVRHDAAQVCTFREILSRVSQQTRLARQTDDYLSQETRLETMSRLWDWAPRWINRTAGPALLPATALSSNVNLSDFLAEELNEGLVQNYYRFTGTGPLLPMMLGLTTLGEVMNLTTTHHQSAFTPEEVSRLAAHVAWRMVGHLENVDSLQEYRSGADQRSELIAIGS